jgi:hypothetical protein
MFDPPERADARSPDPGAVRVALTGPDAAEPRIRSAQSNIRRESTRGAEHAGT